METEKKVEIAEIPLTRGQYAIVDAEDYQWLSKWKWYANYSKRSNSWYAYRQYRDPSQKNSKGEAKQIVVMMHRAILNAPKGSKVDHANHITLDNRRANIRLCTHSQNMQNSKSRLKYKGVYRRGKRWEVCIRYNHVDIRLGSFKHPKTAAKTYDKIAKLLFGEFAYLNFPIETKFKV